jgi:hypothetical protein
MSDKKQTALEWLYDEIKHIIPNDFLIKFKQAKQMEKEQIIDSFNEGFKYDIHNGGGQQYYNETYKQQDNDNK